MLKILAFRIPGGRTVCKLSHCLMGTSNVVAEGVLLPATHCRTCHVDRMGDISLLAF